MPFIAEIDIASTIIVQSLIDCNITPTDLMDNMPTILQIFGWRLFFYANEGNEPIHVHCRKGNMECKYWLHCETFAISEGYAYNMNNKTKREIRKIIFHHFEYIENAWEEFQGRR